MDEKQMAKSLGWFSIGLGLFELAAPKKVADMVGLDGRHGIVQLFGLREIATGIGILAQPGNPNWLQARVAGDALDLALLGSALGEENPKRGRAAAAMAAVAGVTALDIIGSEQLSRSAGMAHGGIHVKESITINRSPEDIYRFWHDFEGLPRIMNHLESVREIGPRRSHWVAKAPAGMHVEWDSEVVDDRPNELIAWRSLEGADVDNAGSVRFERAPGGRGTVVKVEMDYRPPGGIIGAKIAKLFGEAPEKQIPVDLHRLKQAMETGEVATTEGQPAGRARSLSTKYDEIIQT
ncbi:SRPBCC family protein [Methylocaldum sp.]|uniref:SRPBCC family protein n=1 Tax=Methylocaldum sp. TaxID=1969727 RepID=UPI002D2F5039|nr:SRPBCC family protein [Methylocaldum sp.]HYE37913.1 SRPBCC family protein [Methylocaldum sp.]